MVKNLIIAVLAIVVLVHAGLYLAYDTMDACEAAFLRYTNSATGGEGGDVARLFSQLGRDYARDQLGIAECYRYAILGGDLHLRVPVGGN